MSTKVMNQPWLWKRGHDANLDSYVGPINEPVLDYREAVPKLKLMDGVTPGGILFEPNPMVGVAQPHLLSPVEGFQVANILPIFTSSKFTGVNGDQTADTHVNTHWIISTDPNFGTYLVNNSTSGYLTELDLADLGKTLQYDTTYYVHSRYEGATQGWGIWSPKLTFKTKDLIATEPYQVLQPLEANTNDYFGYRANLSGDGKTVVVGAHGTDTPLSGCGVLHIFIEVDGIWEFQQELVSTDISADDHFGHGVSVSDDGNTLVVGAYGADRNGLTDTGAAYIFTRTNGVWVQEAQLSPSNQTGSDWFGIHVTMHSSGNTVVIGAHGSDISGGAQTGAAFIFTRSGSTWTEYDALFEVPTLGGTAFGLGVAISDDGNVIVVGAPYDDVSESNGGAVHVYKNIAGVWTFQQKILAPATGGSSFGSAIDMSTNGDVIVVGRYPAWLDGIAAGVTYVYRYNVASTLWEEDAVLTRAGRMTSDWFGYDLAITADGNTIAVGSPGTDVIRGNAGSVVIFTYQNPGWIEAHSLIYDEGNAGYGLGYSVSMSTDGEIIASGEHPALVDGVNAGQLIIFK